MTIDGIVLEGLIFELGEQNEPEYNRLKLIEELAELQKALIVQLTKKYRETEEPTTQDVVDELGDVAFRIMVYASQHNLDARIQHRIETKALKYQNWLDNKQYIGQI